MPDLFIITGSNGAGKSSIGPTYLPTHIRQNYNVFDGDKLFVEKQRELWRSGIRAHKEAKRIAYEFVSDTFDHLVDSAINTNDHFVYEGHFTNDATWDIPKRFITHGYTTHMIFFGLTNPDLSQLRVIDRVKEGGHYVDRRTIEDNFYGNLEKLNKYFKIIDDLTIVDTSEAKHKVLAKLSKGQIVESVSYNLLPYWFIRYLPEISTIIELRRS